MKPQNALTNTVRTIVNDVIRISATHLNRQDREARPIVADTAYVFGSLRRVPSRRLILEDGVPVRLGSRAFDILNVFVEAAGKTVSNDEIMARAWPTTTVDESSLWVHIGALRKALGESRAGNHFIANVLGRGYAFVAPLARRSNPCLSKGRGRRRPCRRRKRCLRASGCQRGWSALSAAKTPLPA